MRRALLIIFLVLCNILVFARINSLRTDSSTSQIYFLDVGQGDSEMIGVKGTSFLIDGGPDRSAIYSLDKILPSIRRYIDVVFLTHPNADHLNGIREILKSYDVGVFIYAEAQINDPTLKEFLESAAERSVPMIGLAAGDRVRYVGSEITVLSPETNRKTPKDINDLSLVLLLKTDFGRALFTGDIGSETEQNLIKEYNVAAEVLKVGHHGSKYSSSRAFLEAVRPLAVVIEVGKNAYGHPSIEVLKRIEAVGAKTYRTDETGAIRLVFGAEGFKIMKIQ
jgi:competence protein ComEC